MALIPDIDRILLGPGPSMTAPRVMRAMAAPTISHLDPLMLALLDDIRTRLTSMFRAPEGSFAFAVSGTGTSGMEAVVSNLVREGTRATVVVSGYFGDRLAEMCRRYGATVTRIDVEWGRAADPEELRRSLRATPADVVAMVHAETSTGVLNPVQAMARIAHEHDALTIVDAVTSFGGHPLDVGAWGIDAAYSCTQKCLGAPSGMAPVVFSPRALKRRVGCPSFYFDLALLQDYWLHRKYHHTISSPLIYALDEALTMISEEGLEARWARHEQNHLSLIDGLQTRGLSVLPPKGERLWTLNAVKVPEGIDELAVRKFMLEQYSIEIGAGLGSLAGKIWRVGLMGTSSTPRMIALFLSALDSAFAAQRQGAKA